MELAGPTGVERRLAAILAADVADYSRLIEADEEGTLARLKTLRAELIDPKIAGHKGRIVKTTDDGLLVEFASVVDALRCAAEMQAALAESNTPLPPDSRIEFRIGINVGDIVVEDSDIIFGDGVNVAARLEGLAEPGGICVWRPGGSAGRLDLAFEDMGKQALKNIARPVRVYRVATAASSAATRASAGPALPDKPSIAAAFRQYERDPEQEYFADGMVDRLAAATTAIAELQGHLRAVHLSTDGRGHMGMVTGTAVFAGHGRHISLPREGGPCLARQWFSPVSKIRGRGGPCVNQFTFA